MSYGIRIPWVPPAAIPAATATVPPLPTCTRDTFAEEAAKAIQEFHAFDGTPLEEAVRGHMNAAVHSADALLHAQVGEPINGNPTGEWILQGETFEVYVSGHVHSGNDSPEFQSISVNAKS